MTRRVSVRGRPGPVAAPDSDGFLAQVTYTAGKTKFGLNYGESNLDRADGEINGTLGLPGAYTDAVEQFFESVGIELR